MFIWGKQLASSPISPVSSSARPYGNTIAIPSMESYLEGVKYFRILDYKLKLFGY